MSVNNRQVLLEHRPQGTPRESDFRIVEGPIPEIADGQFLIRGRYLSLDPYMRGRMSDAKSYAKPVAIGGVMEGEVAGEVAASRHPDFKQGDSVLARIGWQLYGISDGSGARKVDATRIPLSAYLGAVGMPGETAYIGLLDIGQPKPGETVVVSAASGAVGSAVGQIAKLHGCRIVGIAGGPQKCRYVVDELGFDACVDYKAGRLAEDLATAALKGIDIYFENVGGEIFDVVLSLMNPFGRIPVCGRISQYSAIEPYAVKNTGSILTNRLKVQGFIVSDHPQRRVAARKDLMQWVLDGRLKYRESVIPGLANAPRTFIGLLAGRNFGKQLIKLD
jgi:NADPH-dependent curcumin reductase